MVETYDKELQEELVSGTNIKTINSQSLLGEGNILIDSGSDIPFLFINSSTHLSGDFSAVKNAIANKTPFELYYVNILGYNDVAAPEVCFVSGENIQATFHFESTTANHTVVQTTITPTGVTAATSFHSYVGSGTGTQPQINTITVLTQAEYDRLSTKDPNTQYLIIE